MKTTTNRRAMGRVKCLVAGGVLYAVAVGLAVLALNLMSYPAGLAPVAAAFAAAGAACLGVGAALCFHAAR